MPLSNHELSPPPLKRRKVSPSVAIVEESKVSFDIPPRPPSPTTQEESSLSVYSWNINGITPFLPPTTPKITNFLTTPPKSSPAPHPSLRACLRKWSWPHVVCLQEVKIARSDYSTQSHLRRIINTPLDADDDTASLNRLYTTHFSLPRDPHNAKGFGGKVHGVCTLVRQDVLPSESEFNPTSTSSSDSAQDNKDHALTAATVQEVDWDLEGRVLILTIPSHRLVIFNVYAVNGTSFHYWSPVTGRVMGTRHDRKRAFHTLLASHVKAYDEKEWDVMVIGDMNISRSWRDSFPELRMGKEHVENRADFEKKIIGTTLDDLIGTHKEEKRRDKDDADENWYGKGLKMLDVFRFLHLQEDKYTYRPTHKPWGTGGDRVDMALATGFLMPKVEEADILDTEEDRLCSDHVPLFVKVFWRERGKARVEKSSNKDSDERQEPTRGKSLKPRGRSSNRGRYGGTRGALKRK